MGGVTMDVIDEVDDPFIRAGFVCDFVDDVAEASGLGKNLVDICVLDREQPRVFEGGIGGDPAGAEVKAIDVVGRGKNAPVEGAARTEALEQSQLHVDAPLCSFSKERLDPRLEIGLIEFGQVEFRPAVNGHARSGAGEGPQRA